MIKSQRRRGPASSLTRPVPLNNKPQIFHRLTGTATVSGAGSIWTMNGGLQVGGIVALLSGAGNGGTGTLTISNGGVVTSTGGQSGIIFGDVIGAKTG